jgi:thiol-disulfide isomerase/thioredoxin
LQNYPKRFQWVALTLITLMLFFSLVASIAASQTSEPFKKTVLAELFTATWCQYCPNSTSAINRLASEEDSSQLLVLQYHPNDTDPLGWEQSATRIDYYGVNGYPTIVFDGVNQQIGGLPTNYDNYKSAINSESMKSSYLSLQVTGNISDFNANLLSYSSSLVSATVRFAIYEDNVSFNAPNGESNFRFTVRTLLADQAVNLSAGQSISVHRTFQPPVGWNKNNLGLVVFVQKDSTKEVLQAATLSKQLSPSFSLTITGSSEKVQPNQSKYFIGVLTNTGPADDNYSLVLNKSLPTDWTAGFCTGPTCYWDSAIISVKAGASQEITITITASNTSGTGKATLTVVSLTNQTVMRSIETPNITLDSIVSSSPTSSTTNQSQPSPTIIEIPPSFLVVIIFITEILLVSCFKKRTIRIAKLSLV